MKTSFLFIWVLFLPANLLNAGLQHIFPRLQDSLQKETFYDTLHYLEGKTVPVTIATVTAAKVFFTHPEENEIYEADRKHIQRIIYRTGRVEVLNRPVLNVVNDNDWRRIILTEDPDDTEGFYELGQVEVTVPAVRNRRSTVTNAEVRLKRRASGLGANMVLVTGTEFRGGYGDSPSIIMKGIAYGFQPLQVPPVENH